jgi:hypothetical protein
VLQSAYFIDFKFGQKLLFWGDPQGVQQLIESLRTSALDKAEKTLSAFVAAVDSQPVVFHPCSPSRGMRRRGHGFAWIIDVDTMNRFADLLDPLAASPSPAHQYLDCGSDGEIEVMVSTGEYPADLHP